MNIFDLEGRNVLVTGGYGHLGGTLSSGLAQAGASVFVLGRSLDKFHARFGDEVASIRFVACDVASSDSIRSAYAEVIDSAGGIDVLINNAAYFHAGDPMQMSDEEWTWGLDGALGTAFRCTREVCAHFIERQGGRIINIASMYGMVSPDFSVYEHSPRSFNPPHYNAGKAGMIQLTRYFAHYLGRHGVTVNAISPGPFPNESVQEDREFIEQLSAKTALNRIGRPQDLVGAAVFLSSDASAYVTGHNLVVDGGWTAA